MSIEEKIEIGVKEVLQTNTVSRAKKTLQARSGLMVLSAISFFESALPVPILTDPFLIAAILVDKKNTVKLVLATTLASAAGGVAALLIAAFFFDSISSLMSPSMMAEFSKISESNSSGTFVLTLMGAFTPIPYTIVAWVVAVLKGSVFTFIIASIIGRGSRYALVGFCVYKFGPAALSYAKRYIGLTSIVVVLLAAIVFWLKM